MLFIRMCQTAGGTAQGQPTRGWVMTLRNMAQATLKGLDFDFPLPSHMPLTRRFEWGI